MKQLNRILCLVLACVVLAAMLAGCGGGADAGANAGADEKKQIYVFVKNRGDLSMWDSIAAGGDRAAVDFKDRADVFVIETTADVQACLTAMYEAAEAGADFMYAGNDYADNILEVGAAFPEIAMVSAGNKADMTEKLDRMYAFQVNNDASFLAGILASDVASNGIEGTDAQKTIGFIGGMDETLVLQNWFIGYVQGAQYYDPGMNIVYSYVNNWNDPDTARTQALAQYNDAKADVIYAQSGASANGVYTAAAEVGKYAVGGDVDQASKHADRPEMASRFITSMVVNYDNIIYNLIGKFLDEGKLNYKAYEFLGLADGAISCVEGELLDKYVSQEGKKLYEQAKADIIAGKQKPLNVLDKEQDFVKATIADLLD